MLKVSKLADYAVVLLSVLSKSDGELLSASVLSSVTHIPEPTVAKVTKTLAKAGLIDSIRGACGGYRLVGSADEISLARIVRAIDGPIRLAACVDHHESDCSFASACPSLGRWDQVNHAVEKTLEDISLSDMVRANYIVMHHDKNKEEGVQT